MNNTTTSVSFSIYSNKGIYALILGSGISRSAGIPTGWEVVIDLIKKLAKINNEECDKDPEIWFKKKYNVEPNYSNLLDNLVKTPTERMNLLRPYFEANDEEIEQGLKQPTNTHKFIAKLIKKGYIKVVITTNFDRLLERALFEEGINPVIIKHPDDIDGALPIVHSDSFILKINGDYLDSRLLNTIDELSNYNQKLKDYVLRIVNEFGLISCGWSGKWDIDLVNILRQCDNFRFYSYWTFIENCEKELQEIAKYRRGEIVKIPNADLFFEEIYDNVVALEDFSSVHPMTVDIAIARLKKYIVKDEYQIKLHDLIDSILKNILSIIRLKDDLKLEFNSNNLLPIVEYYEVVLDQFVPVIINGVYWSNSKNYYLFINIIKAIANSNYTLNTSSNGKIKQFFIIPELIVLYSIGISALLKKNYELLKCCFQIKLDKDDCVLIKKVNCKSIDDVSFNTAFGINSSVGVSSYLHEYLLPYFDKYFGRSHDFSRIFDLFEYLLALNYIDLVGRVNGSYYAPLGYFKVNMHSSSFDGEYVINEFINESDRLGINWAPLLAGMFCGNYNVFKERNKDLVDFMEKNF